MNGYYMCKNQGIPCQWELPDFPPAFSTGVNIYDLVN